MVKVFKTGVKHKKQAGEILLIMKHEFPEACANFDLEDCDRILRVESESVDSESVIRIIATVGFTAEELQ
jgi:hypothetical protein